MQKIVITCLLFTTLFLKAQVKDTLVNGKEQQSYTLSNGDIYIYKNPNF